MEINNSSVKCCNHDCHEGRDCPLRFSSPELKIYQILWCTLLGFLLGTVVSYSIFYL